MPREERTPTGYSRPDCETCQKNRTRLVASYYTDDEAPAWDVWITHMNSVHPGWRKGPTFPQTV